MNKDDMKALRRFFIKGIIIEVLIYTLIGYGLSSESEPGYLNMAWLAVFFGTISIIGSLFLWYRAERQYKNSIADFTGKANTSTKRYKEDSSTMLECPNCGNNQWIEGPGGGSFGNITCGKCGSKYNNLGPFGLQKLD